MTRQEFIFWQKVYAQFKSVSSLTPKWITTSAPVLPTANQSALNTFSQSTCTQSWKSWNTNNANAEGACFSVCEFGYVQKCGKDIDMCRPPLITIDRAKSTCNESNWKWNDPRQVCIKECPNGYVEVCGEEQNECLEKGVDSLGINCEPNQLINGTCTRNINKTLGIRQSDTTPNPTVLLQDIVLSATSFVGTMITIALIVMGVKYVKWWYDESATWDLKGNIKKLLIWLFLVIGSYTIIRVIQYVARGY